MNEKSYFLAFTPLHLIVSAAMAAYKKKNGEVSCLIFVDDAGLLNYLPKGFAADLHCYFDDVFILPKVSGKKYGPSRFAIDKFFEGSDLTRRGNIYAFNDRRPEFYYLHSKVAQMGKCFYVEDGLAPYVGFSQERSFFRRLFINVYYGNGFDYQAVLGTARPIDGGYYSFPSLVREENNTKKIFPLRDIFCMSGAEHLSNRLLHAAEFNLTSGESSVLVVLPHSRLFTASAVGIDRLKVEINRIAAGRKLLLKAHPLDQHSSIYEDLFDAPVVLPHYLPAEVALYADLVEGVIGTVSTTLFSAKFLRPDLPVSALFAQKSDKLCVENMHSIGVTSE